MRANRTARYILLQKFVQVILDITFAVTRGQFRARESRSAMNELLIAVVGPYLANNLGARPSRLSVCYHVRNELVQATQRNWWLLLRHPDDDIEHGLALKFG